MYTVGGYREAYIPPREVRRGILEGYPPPCYTQEGTMRLISLILPYNGGLYAPQASLSTPTVKRVNERQTDPFIFHFLAKSAHSGIP